CYTFSGKKVNYYLDDAVSRIGELTPPERTIIITDSVIYPLHRDKLSGFPVIVIPAGEAHKQQATVDYIIRELIALEADRKSFIVGLGGGVVTDMAGYVAAVYMRGVQVGL